MKTHPIKLQTRLMMAVGLIIMIFGIWSAVKDRYRLTQTVKSQSEQILTYRNSYGKLISEMSAMEIRVKDLSASQSQALAELERQMQIKRKNIQAYTSANIKAEGSGRVKYIVLRSPDSTILMANKSHKPISIFAQDAYLTFQAEIYDSLNAPFTYSYSDTIRQVLVREGPWWNRKLKFKAMLSNPNAKMVEGEAVIVTRQYRWSLGPYVGYGVSSTGLHPSVGLSVQYALIRF